jgi:hypothetical protein
VIFNAGRSDGLWENAEEFLAYLDIAFAGPDGARKARLRSLASRTPHRGIGDTRPVSQDATDAYESRQRSHQQFDVMARRCLAAECSSFLQDLPPEDERWIPYRQWISSLNPQNDTIISFNYDRVLALADEHGRITSEPTKLAFLLPHEAASATSSAPNRVPVIKLHGSVDWIVEEGRCLVVPPNQALMSNETRLAIAAPGRSKGTWVGGLFAPLWELAKAKLQHAGAIHVLGYSMPATDARARLEILQAIRQDNSGAKNRRVDVVMGADISRPEVRRMMSLLEPCGVRRKRVVAPDRLPENRPTNYRYFYLAAHPLGAEDFIGDYRDRLRDWDPDA